MGWRLSFFVDALGDCLKFLNVQGFPCQSHCHRFAKNFLDNLNFLTTKISQTFPSTWHFIWQRFGVYLLQSLFHYMIINHWSYFSILWRQIELNWFDLVSIWLCLKIQPKLIVYDALSIFGTINFICIIIITVFIKSIAKIIHHFILFHIPYYSILFHIP